MVGRASDGVPPRARQLPCRGAADDRHGRMEPCAATPDRRRAGRPGRAAPRSVGLRSARWPAEAAHGPAPREPATPAAAARGDAPGSSIRRLAAPGRHRPGAATSPADRRRGRAPSPAPGDPTRVDRHRPAAGRGVCPRQRSGARRAARVSGRAPGVPVIRERPDRVDAPAGSRDRPGAPLSAAWDGPVPRGPAMLATARGGGRRQRCDVPRAASAVTCRGRSRAGCERRRAQRVRLRAARREPARACRFRARPATPRRASGSACAPNSRWRVPHTDADQAARGPASNAGSAGLRAPTWRVGP